MKSLCIKTNNTECIKYLLNELNDINLEDVCFSTKTFKHYQNIIIHYTGQDNDLFLRKLSSILSLFVIDELEESILNKIILQNYFYFDLPERKEILNLCFDICTNDFTHIFNKKFNSLFHSFYDFLSEHKSIVLQGFINFRIYDFYKILDDIVSEAVNQYIIEKEYNEFISLLKLYINSQDSNCNIIHLIYLSDESILLDENKVKINISKDIFNVKYLSDISFSSNDFALNSLLSLIPKKIYIHIIDNVADEFINTLEAIFEKRIQICTDCNLCNLYKNLSSAHSQKSPNTL